MSKTANTVLTVVILLCMAILLCYGYFAIQKLDERKEVSVKSSISQHINYKEERSEEPENAENEEDGTSGEDAFEEYIEEDADEEPIIEAVEAEPVEPAETIEAPVAETPAAKADAAYLVIAGSFKNLSNAETKVQQLKQLGIDAEIVHLQKSGLHGICIAKSETKAAANDAMAAIVAKHNIKAIVYTVP